MSGVDIGSPIRVMLAVLFGLVLCGLCVLGLAATGAFGATASTSLNSTASTFTTLLPYIGAVVASGFVMIAVETGRHR